MDVAKRTEEARGRKYFPGHQARSLSPPVTSIIPKLISS